MKSVTVALLLVFAGVVTRLAFASVPNFAPVASLALFAGYVLADRRWAVAVPLSIMAISDQVLGGYQGLLMLTVYTCLAVPAFWGGWARGRWGGEVRSMAGQAVHAMRMASFGIVSSLLFFFVTNLATWCVTPWYEKTPAGLWLCFARGLEFFRFTLAGDVIFSVILFGVYAMAVQLAPARSTCGSPAPQSA